MSKGFAIGGVAIAVVGAVASLWVPPWLLAVFLAIAIVVLGLYGVRSPQPAATSFPRWRSVMPCYLSIQDRDLRIIDSNDLFRQDFGERIGELCYSAYKHRDEPCPNCPVLRSFADGKTHHGEETVVTDSGEVASVVVNSAPLFDDSGKVVAVVEMSSNVTELKTLQHDLERAQENYKLLFDNVPCYICVLDKNFRILEANELFRADFGESLGHRCFEVYKCRDSICPGCLVQQSFEDGQVHSGEETVTTRDGRQANMVVYSMPIPDEDGSIRAVMEVSTNITQVKKLQHQLATVGMAVSGMSHRLKNILMGLEGGIFIVNTGFEMEDDATLRAGWSMVERNVVKVSRIARDLLFTSKEREPQLRANTSLATILQEVHELYDARASEEGFELHLEIPEDDCIGTYDAEGIHNLVGNLVANAIDACRFDPGWEGKKHLITIRCVGEPDKAVIIVSDNGAGIPDDVRHKVFESFFSTKGPEGTGLGLLVVQKVIAESGGTIGLDSEEGVGTTFTVSLPRKSSEPSSEDAPASS